MVAHCVLHIGFSRFFPSHHYYSKCDIWHMHWALDKQHFQSAQCAMCTYETHLGLQNQTEWKRRRNVFFFFFFISQLFVEKSMTFLCETQCAFEINKTISTDLFRHSQKRFSYYSHGWFVVCSRPFVCSFLDWFMISTQNHGL